eukprot:COSAG01_NODE_73053_length_251_cov_0.684211_1_plen_39_part_01
MREIAGFICTDARSTGGADVVVAVGARGRGVAGGECANV